MEAAKFKVNEIFISIDGEGSRSGYVTTFIRLFGCNLDCSYCDSVYACKGDDFTEMTIAEIIEKIPSGCDNITLTGGEPLDRPNVDLLLMALSVRGYNINIETNGSIDFTPLLTIRGVMITMDYKTISSGFDAEMKENLIGCLRPQDDLKFVVGTTEDLMQMCSVVLENPTDATIFVSPIYGKIDPKEIVEFLIRNKINTIRLQLQAHKFIWPAEMRGV